MRSVSAVRNLVAALLLTFTGAVHAIDLEAAKRDGLVGETIEGYVAVVKEPGSPELRALLTDVNAKRRAEYERIAQQNGITTQQVETLAAKKAIEKTRPGGWVRLNGSWRQK